MASEEVDDDSMPGQDSFIDVVCNMVGILIILVMIVGVRASQAGLSPTPPAAAESTPAPALAEAPESAAAAPSPEFQAVKAESQHAIEATSDRTVEQTPVVVNAEDAEAIKRRLEDSLEQASKANQEIDRAVGAITEMMVQRALVERRRHELLVFHAAAQKEVERRRGELDATQQRQFDVQCEIQAAQIKLHELEQLQMSLADGTPAEEIECVPTPVSRAVDGDEIHARLARGQLAVVPIDELLADVSRRGADYIRRSLQERNRAEEVYGPINGFRMRIYLERVADSLPAGAAAPSPERRALFERYQFLPVSEDLGEPVEQALLPNSQFMTALRTRRKGSPAVTVWVYPDSFNELRTLKRAMWDMGVLLSIRPLPDGQPITGGTGGTDSMYQ